MLVFGDMHQMGPVQDRILSKSVGRAAGVLLVNADLGHHLWREFTTVVELVEQVRVKNRERQRISSHMRYRNWIPADIVLIRSLELNLCRALRLLHSLQADHPMPNHLNILPV